MKGVVRPAVRPCVRPAVSRVTERYITDIPDLIWQTEETGVFSGSLWMTAGTCTFDFGDGTVTTFATGYAWHHNVIHNYDGLPGTKEIRITFSEGVGDVTRLDFRDKDLTYDIKQLRRFVNVEILRIDRTDVFGNIKHLKALTKLRDCFLHMTDVDGDLKLLSALVNGSNIWIYRNNVDTYTQTTLPGSDWDGIDIQIQNLPNLSAAEVSQFIIDLDAGGAVDGSLNVSGTNSGDMRFDDLSPDAKAAYDNLINNKGWVIVMDE